MKKIVLLTTILFFSCEEPKDCAGISGGSAEIDDCGLCTGGTTELLPNYLKDCTGECGGDAIEDCTGICEGETIEDCSGVCGGEAVVDECGVCDGDGSTCQDVYGCTISNACNFNSNANIYDGSCAFINAECWTCDNAIEFGEMPSMQFVDEQGNYYGSQGGSDELYFDCEDLEDFNSGIIIDNSEDMFPLPTELSFSNYPNPFEGVTAINISLPNDLLTNLSIYNMSNELVKTITNENLQSGNYTFLWDGTDNDGISVEACYYKLSLNGCFRFIKKE